MIITLIPKDYRFGDGSMTGHYCFCFWFPNVFVGIVKVLCKTKW